MDITHYTFTLYVFILVCAAIWLFGRVMRKNKKEDKSGYEKEQKLFNLYQNVEDMLAAFEEYTEEAKKDIESALKEARAILQNVSKEPQTVKSAGESAPEKTHRAAKAGPKKSLKIAESKPQMKAEDRIPKMLETGMNKNDIARELGLSVREVSLIMDIKKIKTEED